MRAVIEARGDTVRRASIAKAVRELEALSKLGGLLSLGLSQALSPPSFGNQRSQNWDLRIISDFGKFF